jgi:hypothetical protein
MMDASTRTINDNINAGDPTQSPPVVPSVNGGSNADPRNYNGSSAWGVWGAMGTRGSGEIQRLD